MIFLCFSGKDRHSIVRSILYHLENYGLNVWYDNHRYILGDNKVENYTKAIKESKYAVVILSANFYDSPGAIEELKIIRCQHKQNKLHIFPILYKIRANEVPDDYDWLLELIYNELNPNTGSLLTCNQILCKILSDEITDNKISDFRAISDFKSISKQDQLYIQGLIKDYDSIVHSNIIGRLAILYSLVMFVQSRQEFPIYRKKSVQYIFSTTKLNLTYDFKEIEVMEYITSIILCSYIMSHHQLSD